MRRTFRNWNRSECHRDRRGGDVCLEAKRGEEAVRLYLRREERKPGSDMEQCIAADAHRQEGKEPPGDVRAYA